MPIMAKQGKLDGAPYWYGAPLDQLDFEWSEEEKQDLERYCQQIHQNIAESGDKLTPLERWKATLDGRERDRLFLEAFYFNPYAVRTLDASGEIFKPADVCRDPKLLVKAHIATVARYGLDLPILYPISYTQEIWGADAAMTDYGNPLSVGDYPIKSLEDLEGLEIPDPRNTGLNPGYFWACREIKRLFTKQGLDKVMPLSVCIGNDPLGTVGMFMMGWTDFILAARKNPDLCRQNMDLATEWTIKMGQAAIEAGADCLVMCSQIGFISLKGSEWILSDYVKIGKALGTQLPCFYALTYEKAIDWFPTMREQGAVGPGSFQGWFCADMDYRKVIDYSSENDVYCCCALPDIVLLEGSVSSIEDETKERCQYGKSYSKFSMGIAAVDYTTPPESFAAAVAAAKTHGRFN